MDPNLLLASFFFGMIGLGMFMYGKKAGRMTPLCMGLALMVVFATMRVDRWIARLSAPWLIGYYGANLLLPVGMAIAAGLGGAVAATAVALGAAWLIARAGRVERTVEVPA